MRNYYQHLPYYHKKHHYILGTFAIIILLAIGAGGAYIMNPNSRTTTQQSSQAPNSNSNVKHTLANRIKKNVSDKVNTVKNHVSHKSSNQSITKPGYTLATFPKNIQGTWYSYDKDSNGMGKRIDRITITPTTISETKQPITYLHSRSKKAQIPNRVNSKDKNWEDAITGNVRGISLVDVRGWAQTAGDGTYFGTINSNGTTILDVADGAAAWTVANYFRSPALAKQYANKTFHGEHRNDP